MDKIINKSKKILIVEDSLIHAEWLKAELIDHGFNIINIFKSGKDAIFSVKKSIPDLVMLDFQLPDITGLEVAKKIKGINNKIKIFMLTAHTENSIIYRMIKDKNVNAIAIKSSPYFEENLFFAIKKVCDGDDYIDPSLLGKLRESKLDDNLSSLTQREFEIFIQLNMGKSEKFIAETLNIELASVRNLKSKILKKINFSKIKHLVEKFTENLEK